MNLLKIKNILKCTCTQNSNVSIYDDYLLCDICSKKYPIKENKVFFTDDFLNLNEWNHSEFKFDLFERIKKPKMPDVVGGPRLSELVDLLQINKIDNFIALNLGGGQDKFENVINLDIGNFKHVDLICSLYSVPFKDNSVDLLISNSVLEHVEYPDKVLDEATRVIKDGGYFYLCVPSVCLRHHKMDFTRWTMAGLKSILVNRGFEIIQHGSCRGPGWVLWHMLESLIVSRTKKGFVREILRKLVLLITKPFVGMKVREDEKEENMSLTIYVIAKKIA